MWSLFCCVGRFVGSSALKDHPFSWGHFCCCVGRSIGSFALKDHPFSWGHFCCCVGRSIGSSALKDHPFSWGHFCCCVGRSIGSSALKEKKKKKRTPSFMGCFTPLVMKCVQNCKKTAQTDNFLLK